MSNKIEQRDRIDSDYKFLKERLSWIDKTIDWLYELSTEEQKCSATDKICLIEEALEDIRRDQTSFNVMLENLRRIIDI